MKKNLLFGLAAAALFAACSSDEVTEQSTAKQSPIRFNAFVNKSTKADLTNDNLNNFAVYGFLGKTDGSTTPSKFYDNVKITGSGVGNNWDYAVPTDMAYWSTGDSYWFSAIAPYGQTNDGRQWSYTASDKEGGTVSLENNATDIGNGKQDVIYAYSGKIDCADEAQMDRVPLTFSHMLSRVRFSFKNALNSTPTKVEVTDVRITNAPHKATCNVNGVDFATTPVSYTWTLAADNTNDSELNFGPATNAADGSTMISMNAVFTTDHCYVIPQDLSAANAPELKISFTVKVYTGDQLSATYHHVDVALPGTNFESGKSYTFTAELNATNTGDDVDDTKLYPIMFRLTAVTAWADFTNAGNVDIPSIDPAAQQGGGN